MPRHTGPARFVGIPSHDDGRVRSEARRLLGQLMGQLAIGGIKVGKWERTLPDGTRLVARFDGSTPIVHAYPPQGVTIEEEPEGSAAVWVPRGFVLYPAAPAAPTGWGLPVVQITANAEGTHTPYDPINTDPGLDVDRWTAGGPLGQVLLSTDVNAGYPELRDGWQYAPLMYTPENGLEPDEDAEPIETGPRAAYRLALNPFDEALPPLADDARAAMVAFRRGIFERVNTHRLGIGRDELFMPLRGRFDSAQATADMMAGTGVLGHFSERWPPTYRTPDDRAMHDGLCSTALAFARPSPDSRNSNTFENITCTAFLPTPLIGVDPNGVDILSIPTPGPAVTATVAFEAWINSPIHRALIESAAADMQDGRACITQVGWRGAFAAQHFLPHDQWLGCGNRTWNSRHDEIPPISWHGFPALNLAWETMPGQPAASPADPGPFETVFPFASLASDPSYPAASVPITYVRTSWDGETQASSLTRGIFARGRCVALAPRNGLVWAAAVQKLEAVGQATRYRLVALTHHVEDQPEDRKLHGCTRYLRVWWVDMPDLTVFEANARSFIRGEFGAEDEGFAWDDVNSPYSWQGGVLVDVGRMGSASPNRLKYDSQWVFDSEGRNAACLRAIGRYDQYDSERPSSYRYWVITTPGSALVTLALTDDPGDGIAPVVTHYPAPASVATRQIEDVYPGGMEADMVGRVVAVGYDRNDLLRFAFEFYYTLEAPFGSIFSPDGIQPPTPHFASFGFNANYDWLPSLQLPAGGTTMYSRSFRAFADEAAAGADELYVPHHLTVLDMRDDVAVAVGIQQRGHASAYDDFNAIVIVTENADYEQCWPESSAEFINVRAWRNGARIGDRWYSNPDNSLPLNDPEQMCYRTSDAIYANWLLLPLTSCPLVQPSYVRRGDDWILNIVAVPSRSTGWFDLSMSPAEQCLWPGHGTTCNPLVTQVHYASPEPRTVRGGYSWSSLGDHAELLELTHTPAGGWFNYARIV